MVLAGNVRPIKIEEEMQSAYLDYAMSVIVSRALPDVRDGLKPVHRRILYAINELGFRPNTAHRKCARIVGEVLGKYHPHGDAPVYDALVRMAQDFSLRYPLIDGQGNFGSVDNDPPAAMRYTEARLARIAEEVLVDIDRDTVDFTPNFDGSMQEPQVLPSRIPQLLVNGSSGIAVGMTTSIPPHNLREICDAIFYLIDHSSDSSDGTFHSDATVDDLMKIVQGPDFPTAAIIKGREGIRSAYANGYGRITVEARATIQEMQHSGRYQIIITELPYMLNKATLVEKIADLAKEGKIPGISEVRDESSREGMRVVVELQRGAQGERVLNNLYKHTAMRSAFFFNMVALVERQPRVLNLRQLLQQFITFRQTVLTRRGQYDLKKAQERAHILEGLRTALAHLEEVIQLIRNARDAEAARIALMERYDLSEPQTQAILDMPLRRIAALEQRKIQEEYSDLQKRIAHLEALLTDPKKLLALLKEETKKLREEYGDQRRTEIHEEEAIDFAKEDLIPHQDIVVTLSNRDYVKCLPLDTHRLQRRGGRGSRGQVVREGDAVQHLLLADTHDLLLFFTNRGRVYAQRCFELPPDTSKATRGVPVVNIINIGQSERISALVAIPNLSQDSHLILATKEGQVKRMPLASLSNIRRNGLTAINLKQQDELVAVRLAQEEDDIIMVTHKGQGIRFPASQLALRSRQASTVRGIRIAPDDQVIAMDIALSNAHILTLSQRGFGKLTPIASYPVHNRGGQGVRAFRITEKSGDVAAAHIVAECQEIIVGSAKAIVIRTPLTEIPSLGRNTQGVMVMRKLAPDDRVVSVACLNEGKTPEKAPDKSAARAKAQSGRNGHGNERAKKPPQPAPNGEGGE